MPLKSLAPQLQTTTAIPILAIPEACLPVQVRGRAGAQEEGRASTSAATNLEGSPHSLSLEGTSRPRAMPAQARARRQLLPWTVCSALLQDQYKIRCHQLVHRRELPGRGRCRRRCGHRCSCRRGLCALHAYRSSKRSGVIKECKGLRAVHRRGCCSRLRTLHTCKESKS